MSSASPSAGTASERGEQIATVAMLRSFLESLTGLMNDREKTVAIGMMRRQAERVLAEYVDLESHEANIDAHVCGARIIEAVFAPTEKKVVAEEARPAMKTSLRFAQED